MKFSQLPLDIQNEIKSETTLSSARNKFKQLKNEYEKLVDDWHEGNYTCEQDFCDYMESVKENLAYWYELMTHLDPELYYER